MGDPNARLNALATQGSMAQDLAQCFASGSEAHLESSEVISEVTLPCEFDIQDVLKICRAIKEGEKTRNYTLQVYNCYFFSLAIQACLTRFIAYWEDSEHFAKWHLRANEAVEELNNTDWALSASGSSPYYHVLFKILSILSSRNNQESSLMTDIKSKLQQLMACSSTVQRDIKYRVNNLLWYSAISSSLDKFVEENVIEAVLDTLQERLSEVLTSGSFETLEETDSQLPSILTRLIARAGGTEWPKSHAFTLNKLKQKKISQLRAGLQTLKQDTHLESHIPMDPAAGTSICWPWVQYLVAYFLWALHIVLLSVSGITLLEVSGAPTIAIEKWLDDIVAKLEYSGTIKCPGPEWVIQDMHVLLKDQRAIWNKSPWNSIYVSIKYHMHASANIFEYLEESKPTIGVRFGDAETELNIRVSNFQEHIVERIKMQAKEVESFWLGSSAKIQVELKETLSQVWRMIREDASITEKVVQINHQLIQKLELLPAQDLEARATSWRESLPNLESWVQELLDVASRPDAQPEAMTEYARAKQELDHNKALFTKAQEILNDKQFQPTQAQVVNLNGTSQTVIPRDRTTFVDLMRMWFVQTGRNSDAIPQIGEKRLDLYQLHIEVENLGGPEKVQAAGLWRLAAINMGYVTHEQIDSQLAQIAKVLANAYISLLIPFDMFCLERMRAAENGIQSNSIDLGLAQPEVQEELQQLNQQQAHQQQYARKSQSQPHDHQSSIGGGSLPSNIQAHNLGMASGLKLPFSPDAMDRAKLVAGIDTLLAPHPDAFEKELEDLGIENNLLSSPAPQTDRFRVTAEANMLPSLSLRIPTDPERRTPPPMHSPWPPSPNIPVVYIPSSSHAGLSAPRPISWSLNPYASAMIRRASASPDNDMPSPPGGLMEANPFRTEHWAPMPPPMRPPSSPKTPTISIPISPSYPGPSVPPPISWSLNPYASAMIRRASLDDDVPLPPGGSMETNPFRISGEPRADGH
ncbi:Myoferlin [Rhizoctonia solani]|uniref:Myoferlin n=1 Tax=Rhizoctonia solani TaxID=456999 RepID=A0A0K6GAJ7_9AGAM|nr:Myoferlin [Rhizoctonia solani]